MKFPWCLLGASALPRPPEPSPLGPTPPHIRAEVDTQVCSTDTNHKPHIRAEVDSHTCSTDTSRTVSPRTAQAGGNDAQRSTKDGIAQPISFDYNENNRVGVNAGESTTDHLKCRSKSLEGSSKDKVNAILSVNTYVSRKKVGNILTSCENISGDAMKKAQKVKIGMKLSSVCLKGANYDFVKMASLNFSNALKDASAMVCSLCLVFMLTIVLTTQLAEALPSSSVGLGSPRRIAGSERRMSPAARAILRPGNRLPEAGQARPGLLGSRSGQGTSQAACDLVLGNAGTRASAAAQVLEAEVATSPQGDNKYTAALTVKRALKRYRGPGRLKKQDVITLTLQRRPQYPCVAVASLEVGKRYFVFLDAPSRRNVAPKAIAAPVPYSRRARRLIRQEVCNKCGDRRPPSAVSRLPSSDSAVRGHSLNFTCAFEGSPLPSVAWYKDDLLIALDTGAPAAVNTNTMTISHRRVKSRRLRGGAGGAGGGGRSSRGTRRIVSSLSIGVVEEDHAGVYKCVATSKKGTAEQQVQLSVIPPLDPGLVYPCPYDSFCLNGGTCMFFKFVGELVCQCVEGFKGQRCQEKEVYPTYTAEHGCRGPLAYLRGSRAGLRCPRNQPLALWQLLQRSLADRRLYTKLYPLAKAEVFDLSVSSEEASPNVPSTSITLWQDTPVYNPDTGLLTGPQAAPPMSQKPEQWSMEPPLLTNASGGVSSYGNHQYSSQYFVQLQRNRQILRAILALDMEENLSREHELQPHASPNLVHDSALYGAIDSPQNQRRRGMLQQADFLGNSSDTVAGRDEQPHLDPQVRALSHEALRRAVAKAPLSRGVLHSQSRGGKRHRAGHHRSRQHRGEDSRTRLESRTWSAHIVLTTEMPRPTLEVVSQASPAN